MGHQKLVALLFAPCGRDRLTRGFWSVAKFVERRFGRAGRDGRVVNAATNTAARYGHAGRYGRTAASGHATRPVAIRVWASGYVAERRGHFLNAEDAGRWGWRRC
jgi:hypothetical protein